MTNNDSKREPLLPRDQERLDDLAEEFADRLRLGEKVLISEYVERYPELSLEIEKVFLAIVAIEKLSSSDETAVLSKTEASGENSFQPGDEFGDFRIERQIGRGGMGVVYEAYQVSLDRPVALKVMTSNRLFDKVQRQRFEREAQAVARLHHTNIVPIFGSGHHEDIVYFAMQLIEGQSLDFLIRNELTSASDFPWVAKLGCQVAEGLSHAHQLGVVHRDIKPGNLLIDENDNAWILDFGVAKQEHETDLTHTGDVMGTLRYMAPEQFNGTSDVRSDIFSLGLTLYELLASQAAFDATQRSQLIKQLAECQPVPLKRMKKGIPRDLETIVMQCIAKEPSRRYQSAKAVADDLHRFLEGRPINGRRENGVERTMRWSRQNPWTAGMTAVAVAMFFVVGVVGWAGYANTKIALDESLVATKRAETNLGLSLDAFERVFDLVAGNDPVQPITDDPEIDLLLPTDVSSADLEILEGLLGFYQQYSEHNQDSQRLAVETAHASRRIGEIQMKLGRFAEAVEAFQQSLELYGVLEERSGQRGKYNVELAFIYNGLGLTYRYQQELKQVEIESHHKAIELLTGVDSDRARLELVRTHNLIGFSQSNINSMGQVIARRIAPPTPRSIKMAKDSIEHHTTAREIARQLVETDETRPEYRFALARSDRYLAAGLMVLNDVSQAEATNSDSIDTLKSLIVEFPDVVAYQAELVESYLMHAALMPRHGNRDRVEAQMKESLRMATKLKEQYPHETSYSLLLSRALNQYAVLALRLGRSEQGTTFADRALAVLKELANEFPEQTSFRLRLSSTYQMLGEHFLRRKNFQVAAKHFESAIAHSKELMKSVSRSRFRTLSRRLSIQYAGWGESLRGQGDERAKYAFAESKRLGN